MLSPGAMSTCGQIKVSEFISCQSAPSVPFHKSVNIQLTRSQQLHRNEVDHSVSRSVSRGGLVRSGRSGNKSASRMRLRSDQRVRKHHITGFSQQLRGQFELLVAVLHTVRKKRSTFFHQFPLGTKF